MMFYQWSTIRTPLTFLRFLDPTDALSILSYLPTPNFWVPGHLQIWYNTFVDEEIKYRLANEADLPAIVSFVDFWLKGEGLADKVPGSAHDYFVPAGRHLKYVTKYTTLLATIENYMVGWAVKTHKGVLIHLLVAGTFRNEGIGSKMLELMNPETIRSKMDQAAGNPADWYRKRGYARSSDPPQGKKHNIEVFSRRKTR